ncbi:MAG: hypothetical protein ACRDZ9_02580 [Acidimicrobiales bacterium]
MIGPEITTERFGRPFRQYPAAVSAEAMGLAWARQEEAPHGAVVVVDREISARGRLGRVWWAPAETTLACAVVLRPAIAAEEADVSWLAGGVIAAAGVESLTGLAAATWWPDGVVDPETEQELGMVKAETQLGPGRVRSAVVGLRLDLGRLGLGAERREELLEAVAGAVDDLDLGSSDSATATAAAYQRRCTLLGRRVRLVLLPKGETRGVARRVDPSARLELESATGMVERITIDMLRTLEVI